MPWLWIMCPSEMRYSTRWNKCRDFSLYLSDIKLAQQLWTALSTTAAPSSLDYVTRNTNHSNLLRVGAAQPSLYKTTQKSPSWGCLHSPVQRHKSVRIPPSPRVLNYEALFSRSEPSLKSQLAWTLWETAPSGTRPDVLFHCVFSLCQMDICLPRQSPKWGCGGWWLFTVQSDQLC